MVKGLSYANSVFILPRNMGYVCQVGSPGSVVASGGLRMHFYLTSDTPDEADCSVQGKRYGNLRLA